MRFLLALWLFVAIPGRAASVATLSCQAVSHAVGDAARPTFELKQLPPPEFLELIRKEHGHEFDPKQFRAYPEPMEPYEAAHPDFRHRGFSVEYKGRKVAKATYHEKDGTLRFDIEVFPGFQGGKLYQYLLAQALRDFPQTKSIPSHNHTGNSDNARIFSKKAFGNAKGFVGVDVPAMNVAKGKEFRDSVVAGLYEMPAIKARAHHGFEKITKVVLDPMDGAISFVVEKGPRAAAQDIRIFSNEGRGQYYEVDKEGKVAPLTSNEPVVIRDYPYYPD